MLSSDPARAGVRPEKPEVSVQVTFDKVGGGWKVVSSELRVRGWVPGMDVSAFQRAAEAAKDNCPVSRSLKGNVSLGVEPSPEG
ncbi:MAG: OsmC family protein [Dehalococcoidia bacterium]|nr:OsmC family protein [Dehalococcoidia bacterium]